MARKSHWPRDTERNARLGRSFAKAALRVRSGEPHHRLARCRRPDLRHKELMSRPLGMSGVLMICFRLGSAFGTGMVIEGHAKVH